MEADEDVDVDVNEGGVGVCAHGEEDVHDAEQE